MKHRATRAAWLLAAALLLAPATRAGERIEPLPEALEGVGVDERLDERLPLDLRFTDDTGAAVELGSLFDGEHPVVLTLGYHRCPMLCSLVLNQLIGSMRDVNWTAGDEYRVVSVSISPTETYGMAAVKKRAYIAAYGRPAAVEGWRFLTGNEPEIRALADAVGFRYRPVEGSDDYAHPAVIMIVTPDGRVSRYIYGVQYEPKTLRLSLVEASDGRIGTTIDRVLLYCFHYDAVAGAYAPAAMNLMRVGALFTVVALAIFLMLLWRRDVSRTRAAAAGTA